MKGYKRLTERENDCVKYAKSLTSNYIGAIYEEQKERDSEIINRLAELEDKIESGELGDVKELKQELKAQEIAANAYRIWFEEQKYWREVAEMALDLLAEYAHEFYMKTRFVGGYFVNDPKAIRRKFLKQAEKELAEEEGKDD